MLTIKTNVRKSDIEGNGLFADEDIAADTVIWTFVEGFDAVFTDDQIRGLPRPAQDYIQRYAFRENGKMILVMDNDRFINHSDTPNTRILENGDVAAATDIKRGTEITTDYKAFDKSWEQKL